MQSKEIKLNNKVSSSLFYIYARKKKSSAALNIIMKTLFSPDTYLQLTYQRYTFLNEVQFIKRNVNIVINLCFSVTMHIFVL